MKIGLLVLLITCLSSVQQAGFEVQGHRGCQGLMPENTWPGIQLALDLNVTTVEIDVVITKDRQVVLSHEPWFNHEITTRPDGTFIERAEERKYNIYQMNYEEVKKFDVGMKPHPRFPRQQKLRAHKPLLSEVLDSLKKYMMSSRRAHPFLNIEIKSSPQGDNVFHPSVDEFVDLVMSVVRKYKFEKYTIVQSFDMRPLQYLHKNYPGIRIGYLVGRMDKSFEAQLDSLGFVPHYFNPHYSLVKDDLITSVHQRGMKIVPWTVNDSLRIADLRKMGVDGVITDYPDLVIK